MAIDYYGMHDLLPNTPLAQRMQKHLEQIGLPQYSKEEQLDHGIFSRGDVRRLAGLVRPGARIGSAPIPRQGIGGALIQAGLSRLKARAPGDAVLWGIRRTTSVSDSGTLRDLATRAFRKTSSLPCHSMATYLREALSSTKDSKRLAATVGGWEPKIGLTLGQSRSIVTSG